MKFNNRQSVGFVFALLSALCATSCSTSEQELESQKKDLESRNCSIPSPAASPMAGRMQCKQIRGKRKAEVCDIEFVAPQSPSANNEEYGRIVESDFLSVKEHPFSTFSVDVDTASYSNMRRYLKYNSLPPVDAIRTEELVNYFSYDYPQPKGKSPFSINLEVSECPWAPGHKLAHLGLQGKTIPQVNLPPSNIVFLIDVSGSMEDPGKLPLLKESFRLLVEKLRPQDHVSIVTYAGASGLVLPSTAGDQKRKILDALDNLSSGGGTAGSEGIQLAYDVATKNFIKNGNNRVILATDGDFNVGLSSDQELEQLIEQKRDSGVFLTVLGFGTGNLKDQRMETLADKGNGNHAYIDGLNEAKKVLVTEFGGTMFTIAKDVKLQVEFNPTLIKGYRLIGYENRMLADEDFNDDKKDAGELGSGHKVTALYELIPSAAKEKVREVDPSRYQKLYWVSGAPKNDELMCVKLRYKDPDATESKKITYVAHTGDSHGGRTSRNFRWSAAVAEFASILRDSKYKGKANYSQVLELANGAIDGDQDKFRTEFIELVKNAQRADSRTVAQLPQQ